MHSSSLTRTSPCIATRQLFSYRKYRYAVLKYRRFHNCAAARISEQDPALQAEKANATPERRGKRLRFRSAGPPGSLPADSQWEMTVGLEIHAQLNCKRKLFSGARTSFDAIPNSHVSLFDAAIPGTQPILSKSVVLPALRAALALNCRINKHSSFDRKHYFYKDQPCGFQMTQFYEPFANDGFIKLTQLDGITEGQPLTIGIKQVQLEQDTGKSLFQPSTSPSFPARTLVDLNRTSSPLVEIITTPSIHSSHHASIVLKKIQSILKASSAAIEGMDRGGVRCDVNVSIRRKGEPELGKRVEIKNINSIKAVKDSIDAEVMRQIAQKENGQEIESETRSWDIISGESKKLRGKEAVVDYRYMPDAEVPPLIISNSLVEYIKSTMPPLPEQILLELLDEPYALTLKDANTLMALNDGDRVAYYKEIMGLVIQRVTVDTAQKHIGRLVGNWVLHELGGRLSVRSIPWEENIFSATHMADVLVRLADGQLTSQNAKQLLDIMLGLPPDNFPTVSTIIDDNGLSTDANQEQDIELAKIADDLLISYRDKAESIRSGKKPGLVNFFIGAMMKATKGKVDADTCKKVVEQAIAKMD